ncbi:MAG: hypothetical protein V9G09_14345 [Candidatus Nanopelagicales bacterium]
MTRARWHLGTGSLVLAWLAASVVIALLQRNLPASVWLMVHVTLLGAATNAIVIWSAHFSSALARLPDKPDRRDEIARLIVLNVSVIALLVAVVRGVWPMTLISGLAIVAVIAWHTWELLSRMRRALPSRFGATVRYYLLAGLFLDDRGGSGGAVQPWRVRPATADRAGDRPRHGECPGLDRADDRRDAGHAVADHFAHPGCSRC